MAKKRKRQQNRFLPFFIILMLAAVVLLYKFDKLPLGLPNGGAETTADGTVNKTITMTIPDSAHLRVEYSYRISGTIGTAVNLTNIATIEGYSAAIDQDDASLKLNIQQSNAGAVLVGVKIVKVDKENYNIVLEGAVFKLEQWNGTEYVKVNEFTTDVDGTFSTGELLMNTAYRLIEVKSPY